MSYVANSHAVGELVFGTVQPRPDRLNRDSQRGGDLLVRLAVHPPTHGLGELNCESAQAVSQLAMVVSFGGHLLGLVSLRSGQRLIGDV